MLWSSSVLQFSVLVAGCWRALLAFGRVWQALAGLLIFLRLSVGPVRAEDDAAKGQLIIYVI